MSFSGSRSGRAIVPQLARLFTRGTMTGVPEAQLLEAFIARNDESAFEAIVTRHGPMVLKVCRQLLNDPNDVDDAFQATFIVLARRASSLRRRDLLGNWLYGVAYRVARRARSLAAQRADRISDATPIEALSSCDPSSSGLEPDALVRLHEAVSHLPDRYRIPVVLCYFEGLTHEEAAERLDWPLGSVKGRLARARDLLRKRLVRRGVGLSAGAVLAGVEQNARALVPPPLQIKAVRSALLISGESARVFAATSAISISVATLAQGVIRTMVVSQIRAIVIPVLIGAGVVSTGASVVAFQGAGSSRQSVKPASPDVVTSPPHSSSAILESKPKTELPRSSTGTQTSDEQPKAESQAHAAGGQDLPNLQNGKRPAGADLNIQPIAGGVRYVNIRMQTAVGAKDKNPKTEWILKKFEEPATIRFKDETPLEDVLKYIQTLTTTKGQDPIPIYIDPVGLQEAEKTLQSPIIIKLEGVPLKSTLRLLLKQLGLAYCIHDGFVFISTEDGVNEELTEACMELGIVELLAQPAKAETQGSRTRRGEKLGGLQ
jgi:RNA polymerase sigma factor (sigma-70 family)